MAAGGGARPAAALGAPGTAAERGEAVPGGEAQRQWGARLREVEAELEEDLAALAALEGPPGEAARRVAGHVRVLILELRGVESEHAAALRELEGARTEAAALRGQKAEPLYGVEQRRVDAVQRRRAAVQRQPPSQAQQAEQEATPALAPTAPATAAAAAASTQPAPFGAGPVAPGLFAAAGGGTGACGSSGGIFDGGSGYPRPAQRARRAPPAAAAGEGAGLGGAGLGGAAAPGTAVGSSSPSSPSAAGAPPTGVRWRCSICGLLMDERGRAQRHCATAHGAQPCEPLEVPVSGSSRPAPTSLPAGTEPGAFPVATFLPCGAGLLEAPLLTTPSVLPPVAPIFGATRGLCTGGLSEQVQRLHLGGSAGAAAGSAWAATAGPWGGAFAAGAVGGAGAAESDSEL